MSKKSETAGDRMRRLLAMMPWLRGRPGVSIEEAAAHFGLTEAQLISDLQVVFMVGLPPYTPDALVDVTIDDDGKIWINYADFFLRPLRLTPSQGLALLASSDALLSVPGTDVDGALARALTKLAASLDLEPDESVDVQLGMVDDAALAQLRDAVSTESALAINYYSYARDELGERVIRPWRVFADSGAWYVEAYCEKVEGVRLFRVDRIASVQLADADRAAAADVPSPSQLPASGQMFETAGTTVRLRLSPDAAWVSETYPCEVESRLDDGSTVIDIVVSARPWLDRLLLRLGPSSEVLDGGQFGEPGDLGAEAARRILSRYDR